MCPVRIHSEFRRARPVGNKSVIIASESAAGILGGRRGRGLRGDDLQDPMLAGHAFEYVRVCKLVNG